MIQQMTPCPAGTRRQRGALYLLKICLLAYCLGICTHAADTVATEPAAPSPAAEATLSIDRVPDLGASAPFDIGAVMRSVYLAFRPEAGAWTGGGDTYSVRAGVDSFEVTPVHHPRRSARAPLQR